MKLSKKDLCFLLIIVSLIFSLIPLLFKDNNTTLSILSVSFTAVGAFATVFTSFIAIALYDRFGVDQKIVNEQVNKVLQLVDLLKGKTMLVKSKPSEYMIRPSKSQLEVLKTFSYFKKDANKKIAIYEENFLEGIEELLDIKKSYWLPIEIKKKMEFLDFPMLMTIEENKLENYVFFRFNKGDDGNLRAIYPITTFKEYINNLYKLIISIEGWLKENSSIVLDFKMEEANPESEKNKK